MRSEKEPIFTKNERMTGSTFSAITVCSSSCVHLMLLLIDDTCWPMAVPGAKVMSLAQSIDPPLSRWQARRARQREVRRLQDQRLKVALARSPSPLWLLPGSLADRELASRPALVASMGGLCLRVREVAEKYSTACRYIPRLRRASLMLGEQHFAKCKRVLGSDVCADE